MFSIFKTHFFSSEFHTLQSLMYFLDLEYERNDNNSFALQLSFKRIHEPVLILLTSRQVSLQFFLHDRSDVNKIKDINTEYWINNKGNIVIVEFHRIGLYIKICDVRFNISDIILKCYLVSIKNAWN